VGDSLSAARAPIDEALVIAKAAASNGSVALVGRRMHDLAVRLLADGVRVEVTVPRRRDARALRRAARNVGGLAHPPAVADIRVDLPYPDAGLELLICRFDPRTFPFPRHTVRELGRALTPGGVLALLPGAKVSWPAGLVDAWAAAAGLAPLVERGVGGPHPFAGAIYKSPA
jgi:SAM-dependent methyltransferase